MFSKSCVHANSDKLFLKIDIIDDNASLLQSTILAFGYIANDHSNEELQTKNLFIEVEKKKYPIYLINKPLKQTNFKNN